MARKIGIGVDSNDDIGRQPDVVFIWDASDDARNLAGQSPVMDDSRFASPSSISISERASASIARSRGNAPAGAGGAAATPPSVGSEPASPELIRSSAFPTPRMRSVSPDIWAPISNNSGAEVGPSAFAYSLLTATARLLKADPYMMFSGFLLRIARSSQLTDAVLAYAAVVALVAGLVVVVCV